MISQCESLVQATECRCAADTELVFLMKYHQSYSQRLKLYQKIEQQEDSIIRAVYEKMQKNHPQLLRSGQRDISGKWKGDLKRSLRYCATAVLLDDMESLREKFLLWFQTVMLSFNAQRSCDITYKLVQEVLPEIFSAEEVGLLVPFLELTRTTLATTKQQS